MALEPGRLVLGRFELLAPLPHQGELRRHLARDRLSGEEVEVLTPTGTASLRPGARARWNTAWDREGTADDRLPVLAVGEHDGRPVAVRQRSSLLPDDLRLDPEETEAFLDELLPQVSQASQALGGHLDRHDLIVDDQGRVRLCPGGVVPEESIARPDRFQPAVWGGAEADARFGLGVLGFELLTGTRPAQGRTGEQLARAQARPRRPADVGLEVPEELDRALAGLLSLDASRRLAVKPGGSGTPLVIGPERLAPAQAAPATNPAAHHPIQRRADDPRPAGGTVDLALPRWVVVAEPHTATQAARRRLAALAGLDEQALERAATMSERVAVDGGPDEATAHARALALAPAGLSLAIEPSEPQWQRAALTLIAGLALAAGVGALGILGVLSALLPIFTTLGALLVASITVGMATWAGNTERRRIAPLRRNWGPLQLGKHTEGDAPRLLKDARREVLASELSTPEQRDLVDVIDELGAQHLSGGLTLDELRGGLDKIRAATRTSAIDQELNGPPSRTAEGLPGVPEKDPA